MMEGRPSARLALGVFLLLWSTGGGETARGASATQTDNVYRIYKGNSFHDASERCERAGGQLPVMQSNTTNQRLAEFMTSHDIRATWLGATLGRYPWKWVSDLTVLEDQGCYHDPREGWGQGGDSLSHTLPALSIDSCILRCRAESYKFMAVQVPDVCVCTEKYHARGPAPTARCQEQCPGDRTLLCGSPGHLRVFATQTLYSRRGLPDSDAEISPIEWGEPGPFNDSTCGGVLAGRYGYQLNSRNCLSRQPFLCDFPLDDTARCGLALGRKCLGVVDTPMTWFGARQHCLRAGGDLAKVNPIYGKAWVLGFLQHLLMKNQYYWLGITAVHLAWFTSDSHLSPGAVEEAMAAGETCFVLHQSGLYTRESCERRNHVVLCQFAQVPIAAGEESSISHNAAGSSAPLAEIALGVVLGLIILSLLICILIFCSRRRKRKKDKGHGKENGSLPAYKTGGSPEIDNILNESHKSNGGCAYVANYYSSAVPMPYIDDELVPVLTSIRDDIHAPPSHKANSYRSFTGSFYDNVPLWDAPVALSRTPSTRTQHSTRTLPPKLTVSDGEGRPAGLVCYMRTRSLFDLVRSTRKTRRKTFSCDRRPPPINKRYSWSENEAASRVHDNDPDSDCEGATWV